MKVNKKQGFTLIELVIAIVIIAILSAIAMPKFINISKEARIGVLYNVESKIKATMSLIHTKAIVQGLTEGSQVMVLSNGDTIQLAHGYPVPSDLEKLLGVSNQLVSVTSNYFLNYPVLVYYFSGELNPAYNSPPFPLPSQGVDCFVMYSVSAPSVPSYAGTRIISNGC